MKQTYKATRIITFALILSILAVLSPSEVHAKIFTETQTSVKIKIEAMGQYINWDGVSNVSQFLDEKGELCFAFDNGKYVSVVKTKNGKPASKDIKLKKKSSIFGAVTCDKNGNFYVVSGRANSGTDTSKKTIYITKYNKSGKLLQSVADNGSSSLASYYDKGFYTKIPFKGGNCDVCIQGDYLAVNYAREMYSGHQSNSLFLINIRTMKKVHVDNYYNSHSFAQRVIPYNDSFLLASEGDCYSRAFALSLVDPKSPVANNYDIFHFWVKKGTLDNWDMWTLNNNFAHMGGIATGGQNQAAFVATSVKSLNKNAAKENEQLFIQIFDPAKNLEQASSYITSGSRSGLSGPNGQTKVKNYGVKWLTNYNSSYQIQNPQVVSTDSGKYVILFERYKNQKFEGVFYLIVNKEGKILRKITKLSQTAMLNPCRMPVYSNGEVLWCGNKYNDSTNCIYIYRLAAK